MKYKSFYVYLHRFSNGTLYVGKGSKRRAFQFFLKRHNTYWDRLFRKYGQPKVKILISNLGEGESLSIEMDVIKRLKSKGKTLCNLTDGGNGCLGMFVSDETKAKISKRVSGSKNGMYGKKHTKEAINKMKSSSLNRNMKDKKSPRYNHSKYVFIHQDGRVFKGAAKEFSDKFSVPRSQVSMLCGGSAKSAKGWRLEGTKECETGRKGKNHGRYDSRVFVFSHPDFGTVEMTKYDLYKTYDIPNQSNLSSLCGGKIGSYKGWKCLGVKVDNHI